LTRAHDRLRESLEQALEEGGYRILELRVGSDRRLAVTLDDEPALAINVDDCVKATELLHGGLIKEGLDPEGYHIEVQSPGMNRLLVTEEHFRRFQGQKIAVKIRPGADGRARFTGTLVSSDAAEVHVEVDGRTHVFARGDLGEVRLRA
jgi:ribosome maturation factor RimP